MTKFSIVTPSYNQGHFIDRTVQSVLSQNADFDYSVMDGGSTDETVSVLDGYRGRLQYVSELDRGQADAVNKGIRRSNSEIIGWLNSDDVYYPDTLKHVEAFFDAHPDVDFVYGNAYHIDEHDEILEPYYTEPFDFDRLMDVCFLCQPAVFFRRRVVDKIGALDADLQYCMDYEYWLRAAKNGLVFAHIPEYLAGSRMYEDNKTMSAVVKVHTEINDVFRRHFGKVPLSWLSSYAHAVVRSGGTRDDEIPKFIYKLATVMTVAAVRWNRCVGSDVRDLLVDWLSPHVPAWLRRMTGAAT